MTSPARIYVVDDDEQMRTLLRRSLQSDYDVMCFASAKHFIEVAEALIPGCLILDVNMPEMSGLEVQRWLQEKNLWFPIIMITGMGQVNIAVEAMKAGAVDFVEKPFRREVILDSVRLAQHRLISVSATGSDDARLAKLRLAKLSDRESEVLTGLVAGLPNKTIAYDLGLSPRTVEMHRANLMKKTGAKSLSALVRMALLGNDKT
jgi:two-component system response regulator FixJ